MLVPNKRRYCPVKWKSNKNTNGRHCKIHLVAAAGRTPFHQNSNKPAAVLVIAGSAPALGVCFSFDLQAQYRSALMSFGSNRCLLKFSCGIQNLPWLYCLRKTGPMMETENMWHAHKTQLIM